MNSISSHQFTAGKCDVLINNAGILRDKSFAKLTQAEWQVVLDVHLNGTFSMCHAAWQHMVTNQYGRIVNIGSGAGLYGNFGQTNYSAAKMGILGLTNTLAIEGVGLDRCFCTSAMLFHSCSVCMSIRIYISFLATGEVQYQSQLCSTRRGHENDRDLAALVAATDAESQPRRAHRLLSRQRQGGRKWLLLRGWRWVVLAGKLCMYVGVQYIYCLPSS